MRFSQSTHLLMCLSFGGFNAHHKDWLSCSDRNDRSVNYVISNEPTQMANFPTWILDCDSHSPALLSLFLSSDTSIYSIMTFLWLGIFDLVVVSVSIDFPLYLQQDVLFHHILYDYSCANWDGLCDHLTDNPWEDIFKLSASAAASEFCEWVQVGIDVYIPLQNCQV